ncbi:hypothetical protein CERSUDRAFT_62828 [Gelatoporia subvermispora B]|uniref:GST N-terminal domain-containing protein n=1 Tax=Ceriporiopsis subvermispora (strain B) TaxID=914234 RepID=M2RQX1_CERS8|nr:hypothetical protein CERSUDRAFT_62828 [Gelatoporia subvermispora B]
MCVTGTVVLYQCHFSPFAEKVKQTLLVKGIPYRSVEVTNVMPRSDLSKLLGVTYHRIPVLAIGNDQRFPPSEGCGTLIPPRRAEREEGPSRRGLSRYLLCFYTDRAIVPLKKKLLPWSKLPEQFIKGRVSAYLITDCWLTSITLLSVLSGGHRSSRLKRTNYLLFLWTTRMRERLAALKKDKSDASQRTSGTEAAKLTASYASSDLAVVGFDETKAGRLRVALGDVVAVGPNDYGRDPSRINNMVTELLRSCSDPEPRGSCH